MASRSAVITEKVQPKLQRRAVLKISADERALLGPDWDEEKARELRAEIMRDMGGPLGLPPIPEAHDSKGPTLLEALGDLIGSVTELPADFGINHDFYLHGGEKQK